MKASALRRVDARRTVRAESSRKGRAAAALFGIPFGKVDVGGPADVVVLDYRPPTLLHAENLAGHILFGLDRSHVRSVLVAGRWVVSDRRITGLDARAAFARARAVAPALWQRMADLP